MINDLNINMYVTYIFMYMYIHTISLLLINFANKTLCLLKVSQTQSLSILNLWHTANPILRLSNTKTLIKQFGIKSERSVENQESCYQIVSHNLVSIQEVNTKTVQKKKREGKSRLEKEWELIKSNLPTKNDPRSIILSRAFFLRNLKKRGQISIPSNTS